MDLFPSSSPPLLSRARLGASLETWKLSMASKSSTASTSRVSDDEPSVGRQNKRRSRAAVRRGVAGHRKKENGGATAVVHLQ